MIKYLSNKTGTRSIRKFKKKFGSKIHWRCIFLLHEFNSYKGSGGYTPHIMARIIKEVNLCKIISHTDDIIWHVHIAGLYNHHRVD